MVNKMTKTRGNRNLYIAEKTGYSKEYVRLVLMGKRNNAKILQAAAIYDKGLSEIDAEIEQLQEGVA